MLRHSEAIPIRSTPATVGLMEWPRGPLVMKILARFLGNSMKLRDLTEEELLELFREYDGVVLKSYINGRFNYRSRVSNCNKIIDSLTEQGLIVRGNQTLYGNTRNYYSLTALGRDRLGMGKPKELSLPDRFIAHIFTLGEHVNLTDLGEFFKAEATTWEDCWSSMKFLIDNGLVWGVPQKKPNRFRLTAEGKRYAIHLAVPAPTSVPKKKKNSKEWTIKDEIREGKRAWRSIRLLARAPIPIVPRPPSASNLNRSYPNRKWKEWSWPGGPV